MEKRDPEVAKMEAERVECSFTVPRAKLGSQGLEVSKLGLGCFGLTGSLSTPAMAEEAAIAVINEAFDHSVTFFDTSDFYGRTKNEVLIGKALKGLPREKIQLATKFGLGFNGDQVVVNGRPEYVRACCEGSLRRLGVDYIDLYYQHRVDLNVPIEDTVGEMKKLVEEGKVKYIGLSEASADTIRRAHAVHPITAVQMEWSLWTRDIEDEIVPLCRNLGIGIVAYSPLGIGFFGGKAENSSDKSLLRTIPRFVGDNLDKNLVLYNRVVNLAAKHGCTPAQLALAWLLHHGDDVVPIPGTTKIKNLIDDIGSVNVKLTEEDLKEISDALPIDQVAGYRTQPVFAQYDWQFADTPPKTSTDQLEMPRKP